MVRRKDRGRVKHRTEIEERKAPVGMRGCGRDRGRDVSLGEKERPREGGAQWGGEVGG